MKVKCPCCEYEFEIQTRAPVGSGTRKAENLKMNHNRECIVEVLSKAIKPVSVREVQNELQFSKKRYVRESGNGNTGWNYHVVQADLSNLVGMGKVKMSKVIETFNSDKGWGTRTVPKYELIV